MASASTRENIDEPTRKFLRLPGNAVNALLVKLPAQGIHSDATDGTLLCRVEMWRGGCRSNISVSASFVWRCLSGATMTPFPHPSHRTGHEDFPHPALGQDFT